VAVDAGLFQEFLDSLRRFVRERLVPGEERLEQDDQVPPEIEAEMRRLGLFGVSIPAEFGGLGLGMEEQVRVSMELAYASPGYRGPFGTSVGIGSQGLLLEGTEDQRRAYLPRIASGELLCAFALTEPDAGSDAASLRCSARRDGEGWLLHGTKRFISNAPRAGMFTVLARTGAPDSGARGVSAFLVEAPAEGLQVGPPDRKMGHHGAQTADVVLDGVRVPGTALLGREGGGFALAMRVLDAGRLHVGAVCVGIADRLLDESLRYARQRRQFGHSIGEFQLVQAMLADSHVENYAARCMVLDAARRKDAGAPAATEASCVKLFCSEMVCRAADRALQVFGGAGYMRATGIERFYRDARLYRIWEGTSQIQQLIIARSLLRVP